METGDTTLKVCGHLCTHYTDKDSKGNPLRTGWCAADSSATQGGTMCFIREIKSSGVARQSFAATLFDKIK